MKLGMNAARHHTNNLKMGYGNLRWNDSKNAIKELFPHAVELGEQLLIGKFIDITHEITMMATLDFRGGGLDTIELAPSLSPAIENWQHQRIELENRYYALAETTEAVEVSIESDWADVAISIRRKPSP